MWVLMSTAMMLPTVLPAFATYDDLGRSGAETSPLLLATGFLVVWWGFSLLAAALQMALFRLDVVSSFGDSRSVWLSAGLLAGAGLYQFSALKESCVSKCHEFCIANPGEYMCSGQQVHNDTAAGNKYDKSNTKE